MSINHHPSFEHIRSLPVNTLNLIAHEFRHQATGASHYHLQTENTENVFLVALRTMPTDNTGVAHILEHTALCGSERFPVRDPFFMMIRRSLNTFMNAFTSSDWTAYPFASQNRKDFFNLLDVYLDATFFSRLDPLDFAQEGHRLEYREKTNADSGLEYKGIVFNEMKGAMSSVTSQLWQHLTSNLFPNNTYHFNSGGDPAYIPELTHSQLREFYQSHYHPSNAIFMTFGDIPAEQLQQEFEEKALSRFSKSDFVKSVPDAKAFVAPRSIIENYAFNETDLSNKSHHVMGWLIGQATNLEQLLKAQLLSAVLLDNSACPLINLLETTELGKSPSPLCGLEDSHKELVFVCGLEGSETTLAEDFEKQVIECLQQVAENGIEQSLVDAMMHQLELHQREISGDSYPYGLQLILQSLPGAVHHADPLALLDIDAQLTALKQQSQDPDFIKQLIKELLLENRHRVRLTLQPDDKLSAVREAIEKQTLKDIEKNLLAEEKQAIIEQSLALEARQQQIDDMSILPKVSLEDVPAEATTHKQNVRTVNNIATTSYSKGTNGLHYQQVIIPLPELSQQELELIPLYCNALTETGIGDLDYIATQAKQAQYCGSLVAYSQMRSDINNEQLVSACLVLSGKSLSSNAEKLDEIMLETINTVRFDELARLKELMQQQAARREQSVSGSGHALAMSVASAEMNPQAHINHSVNGMAGIKALKKRLESCEQEQGLKHYAEQLQQLHQKILKQPQHILLIGESEDLAEKLSPLWAKDINADSKLQLAEVRNNRKEIWKAQVQVNYCAMAFPTVAVDHPDAAPLTVLGGFLRNGFLHREIREQGGAYGGGATQDSNTACFKFYSYRDPRLEDTLQSFRQSINWLIETEHEYEALEEAILGVMASLDKPGSPAGEAKHDFYNKLFGRDDQQRQRFRERILNTSLQDLKRVAKHYLLTDDHSCGIITHEGEQAVIEKLEKQGYVVHTL